MPPFSKVHSTINIQLIRNADNKKSDDTILIRPTYTEGVVYLRYQDSVNKSKHELRLTNEQVCHYFVSLFHAMSYDTDPFVSVQVNFPAFPCVLLNVKDLMYESLRMRLQSMIQFTLNTSFVKMDDDDDEMPPLESGGSEPQLGCYDCDDECDCC